MADTRARVTIVSGSKKIGAIVPTNVSGAKLLPHLVKKLELPAENEGGAPMSYVLHVQASGDTDRTVLDGDRTLDESGVTNGTTLTIMPAMTAGARRTTR